MLGTDLFSKLLDSRYAEIQAKVEREQQLNCITNDDANIIIMKGLDNHIRHLDQDMKNEFGAIRGELTKINSKFGDIDARLDCMDQRFVSMEARLDGMNQRFVSMEARLDGMDKRFDGVDEKFEGIDKKFEKIDKRFEKIDTKFDDVQEEIKDLRKDMNTNNRWLISVLFVVTGIIIGVIKYL